MGSKGVTRPRILPNYFGNSKSDLVVGVKNRVAVMTVETLRGGIV